MVICNWDTGTHTYSDGDGYYDVKKIVTNAAEIEVQEVQVELFREQLQEQVWDDPFSRPIDIIKRMDTEVEYLDRLVAGHAKRIREADLQFPVLVNIDTGLIIDGMHRLSKCFYYNIPTILVKYISTDIMNKSRLSKEDEDMISGFE